MLAALLLFAAAAAVSLPAPSPPGHYAGPQSSHPSSNARRPYEEDAAGGVADLKSTSSQRGAHSCDQCRHLAEGEARGFKNRERNITPPVSFVGSFVTRRSSETQLPTRDKHVSPVQTPGMTSLDVKAAVGVLHNVHLFSEKELGPRKTIERSSHPPSEDSVSADGEEGLSSPLPITKEERDPQSKAPSIEEPPHPVINSTHHSITLPGDAGSVHADGPIPPHLPKMQRVEVNASAVNENATLAYNEYRTSGGANVELHSRAEQVDFSDRKSASLSSGSADTTVVEVEISESKVAATGKETEEMIIKDTTLIIVFSCLAVLVIVVCKIVRYVMDYKLSKFEERMQNAGARPPC